MKYCQSSYQTERRITREVKVGNVGVGGNNPIRIQSMTTSNTRDVDATVEQVIRLADSGCEIARVTVQGKKEAEACEHIKDSLIQKGYTIPLVADIHFYPPAAMMVADFADKVRINPGNYVDKRASFKEIVYTDEAYASELARIEEKFTPLVLKCKSLNKAMRIGTNHGSLSDRIMNRYGDTPQGMVKSALEFARICRSNDYHDFIFSMKASNTHVMIQAYRLLVAEMYALGWDYPLHLGVTEAGEGEDGRVKSAIGIGSLLLDGLGDTIRVSLTEDPWYEIDPCQRLVAFAEAALGRGVAPFQEKHRKVGEFHKREVEEPKALPLHRDGSVGLALSNTDYSLESLGGKKSSTGYQRDISTVDIVKLRKEVPKTELEKLQFGILEEQDVLTLAHLRKQKFDVRSMVHPTATVSDETEKDWEILKQFHPEVILLSPNREGRLHYARKFFEWLQENQLKMPVLLNFHYEGDWDDVVIQASAECGSLFCDGLGDGMMLEGPYPVDTLRQLSFNILQGSRMRTVKTEFISCPSCGRTLFNLQEVSERIRQRTGHLPGVKVAIMGCIVNGPGEMADADFGYVGSKAGMVDLYVGKTCVEKNIEHHEADDRLIELIKAHGRWVEPLLD